MPYSLPKRSSINSLEPRQLFSSYFASPMGADTNLGTLSKPFKTIQHAIDAAAHPGDVVNVRAGTYREMLTLKHSGSAAGGSIVLQPYNGEHVLLSGSGAVSNDIGFGNCLVQIVNQSYVRVSGFEMAFASGVAVKDDAFGIRVQGAGTNVALSHNVIHDITGKVLSSKHGDNVGYAGAGIQVYGSSLTHPYSNVTIDGNTIYNCQPGDAETETLTVNGNVTGFQITHNVVHDNNNIGIVMIGGEASVFGKPDGTLNLPVARNGVCSQNTVYNNHANYGGGFAGGIYVDGGQNIRVSENMSYQNDLGLEVGCENRGYIASGITVENNILSGNTQGGLLVGGYDASVGRVKRSTFRNNTVYGNDMLKTGSGQLLIQYASGNTITNNIFVSRGTRLIGTAGAGNSGNLLDHNLYFATSATNAEFDWNSTSYSGLAAFKIGTGQDRNSLFADARFVNVAARDFRLAAGSPAANSGSGVAGQYAVTNFTGVSRKLPPNIGAY